jgi:MerR family mercuric resistance operon transcriptional regulator
MTTGQLAEAVGVGVETVRYYERVGILPEPPRTAGGHRQYRETDARRLRFVRRAQELGFTLNEIKGLLELRVEQGKSCVGVASTADQVIARIEGKVRELQAMRRTLAELRAYCAAETPTGECPILDALEDEEG